MGLAYLVEYLLAQRRSTGGGRLVSPARIAFAFPVLPAGIQVNFSILPPMRAYGAIKYAMSYNALPGVIYLECSQGGDTYIQGLIEPDHLRHELAYWILYTQSNPIDVMLVNQSPLAQAATGTQYSVTISNEEDYKEVLRHLQANDFINNQVKAPKRPMSFRAVQQ